MVYCGFSVHGVSALAKDLETVGDPAERARLLRDLGHEEARLTSTCGGNCLRVFYFPHELLAPLSVEDIHISVLPWCYQNEPWASLPLKRKFEYLSIISLWIWKTDEQVRALNEAGDGLAFADLDAYLAGVSDFNASVNDPSASVRILLTAVVGAPRAIIELPGPADLGWASIPYGFDDIFGLYCRILSGVARRIVARYASAQGVSQLIVGYELVNEPDYEWLPDEQRIEHALDQAAQPLNKYITEQHSGGIPNSFPPGPYAARTEWGSYEDQSGGWTQYLDQRRIGVLDYPWGPKFDWYLRCYGQVAEAVSFAIADEAARTGQKVEILSGGVTHVNVDYLTRLAKIWPDAFKYCSTIAIHPYHWPETDIYDTQFVGRRDFTDWKSSSPREFALYYMKCFDFYKVLIELIASSEPPALMGKKVWISEIGNGSKLWGQHNSRHWQHVPFVRLKSMQPEQLPRRSVIWDDLWDAFFSMVSPEDLKAAGIEGFFFYTLREAREPGLDRHDDDRTNYSFLKRNGLPRLSQSTFAQLKRFMSAMSDRAAPSGEQAFALVPPWTRWRSQSTWMLEAKPWLWGTPMRAHGDEAEAFLFWLTSEYYQGRGRIVISTGASATVVSPLSEGLFASWPEAEYEIDPSGSKNLAASSIEIALFERDDLNEETLATLGSNSISGQTMIILLDDRAPDAVSPFIADITKRQPVEAAHVSGKLVAFRLI